MFPEYSKDFYILSDSMTCPSFANPNITSYNMCASLVHLKTSGCSQNLYTSRFFLTSWLIPNHVFPSGPLFAILPQSSVFDSNSQHKADDNIYFILQGREKARYMSLPTKAIAIGARKKVGHNS